MKWIGLSGGIASGKSTVSEILRRKGYPVVDADEIAKEVLKKEGPAFGGVVQAFGPGILNLQGEIDRGALAKIVFHSPSQRNLLESLVHPEVQKRVSESRQKLEKQGQSMAFYDVPLLFEKNLEGQFDKTLLVFANEAKQKERMKQRNAWSESEIEARLKSQLSMEEKRRRAHVVIENNGTLQDLEKRVEEVLKLL